MTVLAPEAPKAATLSGEEVVHAAIADIAKWEEGPDGSLYVYGRATTPEVDTDEQVVSSQWSGPALKTWLADAPALRVQHNANAMPAGSGIKVEVNRDGDGAHWVKGVVDEPVAKMMVRKGHLRAFSVGIARPVIERDVTGKARGGIITGGRIVEVSLVDSPANRSCWLEMARASKSGKAEFASAVHAPGDVLAKYAAPAAKNGKDGLTTVELPSDMKLQVTPATLAKLATLKRKLVLDEQAAKQAAAQPDLGKTAEPATAKRDMDPDVGGGVDRDKIPAEDFVDPKRRRFPIVTAGDVSDAVHSYGRAKPKIPFGKFKKRVEEIARRKGFESALPEEWKHGKEKAAKPAAVTPRVTKCFKCDDTGMAGGKPCTGCKAGKRAARALAVPAAEKKKKVMCLGCGAKQNHEHAHCSECGAPLAGNSARVVKNHDFACLGCGKDLDKGEKHCPGCGRENPGYNPMADRKIPGNEDKAAKERVGKSRKTKGSKKKTRREERHEEEERDFGGHAAPEFGSGEHSQKRRKGKGKGRSPAKGVTGQHTEGLPPHREPDGPPVEEFENTANLQDGDEREEMAAAMRHKALGIDPQLAVLHDLTCPAFSPAAVAKALPHASFTVIDTQFWQDQALKAAAGSDIRQAMAAYNQAQALSQAAVTLKTANEHVLHEVLVKRHADFRAANADLLKTFTDATPGPGSFPTPGHVEPGRFRRPYISAGHGAPSPQADGPRTFPVTTDHPEAEDFTRGYLHAGHAADAPVNDTHRSAPVPGPTPAGAPAHVAYEHMQHADYEQAANTMHDHLSRIAPGMCPMSPEPGHGTQKPAPQVPEAVGSVVPHRAGKSAKARKAEKTAAKAKRAAKAARAAKQKARRERRQQHRAELEMAASAAQHTPAADADAVKAAVKAATAPLLKRQARQDKALRKAQKVLDAIAGQADTRHAPYRGAGGTMTTKASAGLAAPRTAAEAAALAQAADMQRLSLAQQSYDPVERESARRELISRLGLDPMTGHEQNTHPFRT